MPRRRSFLIGCGCIVAAPAIAEVGLLLGTGNPPRSLPAAWSAHGEVVEPTTLADLVMRIDGWESPVESDQAQTWIRINSSWRSDWH